MRLRGRLHYMTTIKLKIEEEAQMRIKAGIQETPFLRAVKEGRIPPLLTSAGSHLRHRTNQPSVQNV